MISTFNLEKLSSLLRDFYTVTHIRITVFDENFNEIASYPNRRAEFCRLIRQDEEAKERCVRCDKEACRRASSMHDTYIYQCHAGLTEAITPIHLSNIVIGYLFFGHVFSYPDHETGWQEISEKCRLLPVDSGKLKAACEKLSPMSADYIRPASHLLQAVASYLCLERMVTLRHENLPVQIDNYITSHLTEPIDSERLCSVFSIGKTRLYEIAKESYGCGIAEHIRRLRIEKAKALLTDRPDMPDSEAAFACGFTDYNYFITVFKKYVGISPGKFARKR